MTNSHHLVSRLSRCPQLAAERCGAACCIYEKARMERRDFAVDTCCESIRSTKRRYCPHQRWREKSHASRHCSIANPGIKTRALRESWDLVRSAAYPRRGCRPAKGSASGRLDGVRASETLPKGQALGARTGRRHSVILRGKPGELPGLRALPLGNHRERARAQRLRQRVLLLQR